MNKIFIVYKDKDILSVHLSKSGAETELDKLVNKYHKKRYKSAESIFRLDGLESFEIMKTYFNIKEYKVKP